MDKATNGGIDPDQCAPSGQGFSVLWNRPSGPSRASLILAHGAGAPMDSPFMASMAEGLAERGITVARFEFSYMAMRRQTGGKRPPSRQAALLDEWRQVHAQLAQELAGPVAIGGKSMGGRMASLLADELAVPALVCLGFPFHAPGKPPGARIDHLAKMQSQTLIVQGTRDAMGSRAEVEAYSLSPAITLHWLETADHDLKPLKSAGCSQAEYLQRAADRVAEFLIGQS